jgi:CxxC motif-containing protein (DUF1111 family)
MITKLRGLTARIRRLKWSLLNNRVAAIVSLDSVSHSWQNEERIMRCTQRRGKVSSFGQWSFSGAVILLLATCSVSMARPDRRSRSESREHFEARQLFEKAWAEGAPSPAGGDGLGPLFNERSCVGCHHLGGVGGAGGNNSNVVILSATTGPPAVLDRGTLFQGELEDLHPGFRTRTSVVVHEHATTADAEARLTKIRSYRSVQTRDDVIALEQSRRNTPALFGLGRIDSISDSTLLEAEKRKFAKFPEIKGRVSMLRDGRLGRFGWKGQTATLREFVLAACANELGLEVPGHHQVTLDRAKDFNPSKLQNDLSDEECGLLVEFVRSLPTPILRYDQDRIVPPWGYTVFETVGCASCHAPRLGRVNGIYSDLLLHDLGDRMRAAGGYGSPSVIVDRATSKDRTPVSGEASPNEWRTPPLWGVANSGPYLHDGRAETLDEAIRLHGGEAAATSERYGKLSTVDHNALILFLRSLTVSARPTNRSATAAAKAQLAKHGRL